MKRLRQAIGCSCFALAIVLFATRAQAERVELELVLAVDASISVSREEYRLQHEGYVRAFRSPAVARAIETLGGDGIAVTMFEWGNVDEQFPVVAWSKIANAGDAYVFAGRIAETPRTVVGGATALAKALQFAGTLFHDNGYESRRRVIDISGDGRNNRGDLPGHARDAAIAAGITINGLAIMNEVPFLDVYYQNRVIGGPDAFVEPVEGYDDFSDALIRKLVREITGAPTS